MSPLSTQEAAKFVKQFRWIFLISTSTVLFGTIFYHHIEKWNWVDAYYFSVVSLTTVGYGDLTPTTNAGKVFTTFYLIIGISIIAALLNNIVKNFVYKRELHKGKESSKAIHPKVDQDLL